MCNSLVIFFEAYTKIRIPHCTINSDRQNCPLIKTAACNSCLKKNHTPFSAVNVTGRYFIRKAKKRQNSLKSGKWIFIEISKILNKHFIKMVGKSTQMQYPFESSKLSTNFVHRC
jgi:hypothetical protein